MAKQHVGFFERHVEKCALGLGGVVLLGVAALYLVQTPNTVELATGDKVGPAELYKRIGEVAQVAAGRMGDSKLEDFPPLPPIDDELNPLRVAKLPPAFAVPMGPPRFDVPQIHDVLRGPTRKIEIAEIHPPSQPILSAGRASIALPAIEYVSATGSRGGSSSVRDGKRSVKRDRFWIALAGLVNRKKQHETFRAARYEPEQDVLVVSAIEVQRQELLGDGLWSEPVIVEPYVQRVLNDVRQVDVIFNQKDGTYAVLDSAFDVITGYQKALSGLNEQIEVLRPEFQTLLEQKDQWRWFLPKKLVEDGEEVDMCDAQWGVYCPPDEDKRGSSGRDTSDRDDAAAARKAREDLRQAEVLLSEGKYLEAGKLLYELKDSRALSPKQLQDVEEMIDEHEEQIVDAMNVAADKEERDAKKLERQFGPDYDPYWATDISIEPGKTYRYRVRVLALNRYAGMASYLSEPMAAGQVIIPGQWSEWSEPLAVRASAYLLATQDAGTNEVSVYLYRWRRNKWSNERPKLTIGQEVTVASSASVEPTAGQRVLVDFSGMRAFPMSEKSRDGSYHAVMQPTTSLTLVDDTGEVEERFKPLDTLIQKDLRDAIKKQGQLEQLVGKDQRPGHKPPSRRGIRDPGRRPPGGRTPEGPRPRGKDQGRGGGSIAS